MFELRSLPGRTRGANFPGGMDEFEGELQLLGFISGYLGNGVPVKGLIGDIWGLYRGKGLGCPKIRGYL